MVAVTLDPVKVAQKLQDSGLTKKQAVGMTEVLVETMAGQATKDAVIEAVQESALGINRRAEATERRLITRIDGVEQRLTTRIDGVEQRIDGVEQRLSTRIDGVEQRIDGVEQRLSARIDEVEQRIDARIDGVDQRIDGVERRVHELGTEVKVLTATMNENHLELNRKLDGIMNFLLRK
jgi:DNA anti-recombination protein RmuC